MRLAPEPSFAEAVRNGLGTGGQKQLPPYLLYDAVGSALFDAITELPEYGLTRADIRLLESHAADIARECEGTSDLLELGSGNGSKIRPLLLQMPGAVYRPIDISAAALERCRSELAGFRVEPIEADFMSGLAAAAERRGAGRVLVAFLGSNLGNFQRPEVVPFLKAVRERLRAGDMFLIGADLLKPVERMIAAYDDAAGVTAAFNRNLLARLNRQLDGDLCVRCFEHEARWNAGERRIEMHLRSRTDQRATFRRIGLTVEIRAGETIWTECSHKFEVAELTAMAQEASLETIRTWTDPEWPFAEVLLRA